MIICEEKKFVFIRNPKTATRSITEILQSLFSVYCDPYHHAWNIPDDYADYFTFLFTRNPFSRTVSAWLHVCDDYRTMNRPTLTLAEFLEGGMFCVRNNRAELDNYFLQSHLLDWIRRDTKVEDIHVCRYERLEQDFHRLPFIVGRHTLPKIGKSNNGWQKFYTPALRDLAAKVLEEDFERLGYRTDFNIKLC